MLLTVEEFDAFSAVRDIVADSVPAAAISTVRDLDERMEIEPYIRQILFDSNETPHGPAEIVDILTHKVRVRGSTGMAAFILKGRSFTTVRPSHVAHQIFRLERIPELRFAVLAAGGIVLDEVKEQFISTAVRLQCDYGFLDAIDLARLFIAYGFLCARDGRRVVTGRCVCGYSPQRRILNIFQKQALVSLKGAHEERATAGAVFLPPGSGKTRIAAEDAFRLGAHHVLYVAHTHEILDVALSEFESVFGRDNVKKYRPRVFEAELPKVLLATVQALSRQLSLPTDQIDYLVIDEFHHAAAPSYRRLLNAIPQAFVLGLTATPFRGDRQDIVELCEGNVLIDFELRTGIEQGILAPYHYYGCFDGIDYSRIRRNGTRYDIRDLERALIIPERDAAIISKWRERADGKPTLAFCCSRRHALRMAQSFREAGVSSEAYLGTTSEADRRRLLTQLAEGALRVLCVVDVLNEGVDVPFVDCLLFLRPTESQRIFYQQLGRGLRRAPGKAYCEVIDFIGNFRNAYKVVEYQGLLPFDETEEGHVPTSRNPKELLNLPLGCQVFFEEEVIDIFARQVNDPRRATRHNIGRILLYQYLGLAQRLGRVPMKIDVDRNLVLHSGLYELVFGSWRSFYSSAASLAQEAIEH